MIGAIECPGCGQPLPLLVESRKLQIVGGDHVVTIRLAEEAKAHLATH